MSFTAMVDNSGNQSVVSFILERFGYNIFNPQDDDASFYDDMGFCEYILKLNSHTSQVQQYYSKHTHSSIQYFFHIQYISSVFPPYLITPSSGRDILVVLSYHFERLDPAMDCMIVIVIITCIINK